MDRFRAFGMAPLNKFDQGVNNDQEATRPSKSSATGSKDGLSILNTKGLNMKPLLAQSQFEPDEELDF